MKVVVIGAGAAGLMAATEVAMRSQDVRILEKSNKVGVKILISGGTRCNVTHDTDAKGVVNQFGHARRFLQPSVGAFPPASVIDLFKSEGVDTQTEAGGKVFPTSNRAIHVRDALVRRATRAGVTIETGIAVTDIARADDRWRIATDRGTVDADRVIVTCGGRSYPGCGTTGDGYRWLQELGHTVVTPRPALVPLTGGTDWTRELSGITFDRCTAKVYGSDGKKAIVQRTGALLLTHFGLSGPLAMDLSGAMTRRPPLSDYRFVVDLLPAIDEDSIREALNDRRTDGGRRRVSRVLSQWLPDRFATAVAANCCQDVSVSQLTRRAANALVDSVKRLNVPLTGTRGFEKAEVTAGGVALGEVNPRTMASRVAEGLFVAGEILDLDGPIGGYNFQAAFSTGRAAGIAASLES